MRKLEETLILRIIEKLDECGDPFYPVSHLAHDLKEVENEKTSAPA